MRFATELQSFGGAKAGFVVPEEVVEGLGGGKRPKVTVVVDDYSWRSSVAPMGGMYLLGVSNEHRARSGLTPGRTYVVDLELDTAPRIVEVPGDLAAALDGTAGARERWEALSYSYQRQHAEAVASAKAPATRERRIAKCLELLTG